MMDDYDMEDVSSASVTVTQPDSANDISVAPPTASEVVYNGDTVLIVQVYDDQTSTPDGVQAFLARWPPSRTPSLYCAWIAVDRGGHNRHAADIAGLSASFDALKSSEKVTVDEIDRIAQVHGVLSGKWLIYAEPTEVDEIWGNLVRLLCLGLKRGSIKVSPKQEGEPHVICVYADDYRNTYEVNGLRDALRAAGVKWRIGFKPDVYTHLGIYAKNQWRIRPSRYYS